MTERHAANPSSAPASALPGAEPTLPQDEAPLHQRQGLHAHGTSLPPKGAGSASKLSAPVSRSRLGGGRSGHAHSQPHSHHHGLGHGHSPRAKEDHTGRALLFAIALNGVFASFEFITGTVIGSMALIADALHNLSDVAGLVLAWAGVLAMRKKPDARHTYGWRRASILAAFFNALLLLVAMGWLASEALDRFGQARDSQDGWVMIVVASVGILVNGVSAWMLLPGSHRDLNLRGAYLHLLADALVSLGVVIAGVLLLVFGWLWVDPAVSLAIGLVVFVATWGLFRKTLHLLFDGVPDSIDLEQVRQTLLAMPGVTHVDDLHVWAMGSTQSALTAHLVAPLGTSGDDFLRNAVRTLQEQHGIAHVTLQITREHLGMSCEPLVRPHASPPGPGPIARAEPLGGASA
jgi:cobalt-zinc-cadmium efflux system protein